MFPKDYEEIEKVQFKIIKKLLYFLLLVAIASGALVLVWLIRLKAH